MDCVAGGVAVFAEMLGVDPTVMSARASEDRKAAEIAALFDEEDDLFGTGRVMADTRAQAAKAQKRH
ncbi:hypothetical protein GCM10011390_48560 [Aureimonas endophytica]|uniref:Uncharacterized protein n=1 Tax=Aureimonas endophytica TaxID=2027858 RepID=A0A917A2Q2_9HYPH|nr:hypothetical protein [Aureimonas endophytica]GGE23424.1 hypothetical protein GCM10011390_48560 [Aureimonas endophytica]